MPPPIPDRTETLAPRPSSAAEAGDAPVRDRTQAGADDPERYEQIAEHGRGGLGRVVRAVDRRLGRTVAVKELLRSSPATEARFVREALITARLEHPGIVPVHEAGRWPNGDPYYVMKLVEGRTLKELIEGSHTLRARMSLLPHVIAIADAVGYAHSEGVIHRDLKPSNVIVGEFGETIVIDWGLARDRKHQVPEPSEDVILASGSGLSTVSGKVVGTPAYMSPEQARGEQVDERADVYAIGAVLYEVLAGRPPHHDHTPQATLERVIAGPPCPVGLAQPHIPSEIATIVGKAMARGPDERYANAAEVAEDLRRFTTGKLVSAHTYSTLSLLRKKIAQHRGVVAVAVASTVALAAVGVESFRRVVAERNIAQTERAGAEDARSQAERRQRELVLLQAMTSLRKDPTAALAWLKTYEIADADRGQLVDVIDEALALGVARHVFRPGDWVLDIAFTPDGQTVVAAVRDGVVRAYDLRRGTETSLGRASSAPELLAMSRDGRFVVTGDTLGEVAVWPLRGGTPRVLARGGAKGRVTALSLSPDNARVLVHRESGAPQVLPIQGAAPVILGPKSTDRTVVAQGDWSRQVVRTSLNEVAAVEPSGELRLLGQVAKAIWMVDLSPRGDAVLVHDGKTVWTVPFAGGPMTKLVDYAGKILDLSWSPDERTLAVSGELHHVVLVDVASKQVRELRGHTDQIYMTQWTRDGRRLLSAGDDGTARVWTVADGTASVLRGHDDDVYRARFSADERQVVTAGLDGSVRVWSIDQPGARTLVEGEQIDHMELDGDRALVKTRTEVARWDLASGRRESLFSWGAERDGLGVAVPSPDGERLLVPTTDWSIEVRRRKGPAIVLRGHRARISHVEFSRDGTTLFTSSFDGTLRRWDLETGAGTKLLDESLRVNGFAVARDGRVAAQVGEVVKMIAPDGAVKALGSGPGWCVQYAEFDRVRDRLIMRRCDHSAAIVDGERVIELPTGNYMPSRIAVSPDGSRIAGAMRDRTVRMWDAATGSVLKILRGHSDLTMDVAFSPDGTMLASSAYDKTVRVWELATGRFRVLRGHTLAVNRVFWRDAERLVTASSDGTLRVWDVPSMDVPSIASLAKRLTEATSARIDIDRPTTADPLRHGT
ncbi:MAG: protein kinase [Deltaproteobacteria bacterium]|nr:protein kinase [Deltaproteobacteria bacterium]